MRHSEKTERGSAVVEFALIVPVIFLLLAAIVDFGYRYEQTTMINNAAQIAARDMAIKHDQASSKAAAISAGAPSTATFNIPTTCTAGTNVTVTISATEGTATKSFGLTFTAAGKGVALCSE